MKSNVWLLGILGCFVVSPLVGQSQIEDYYEDLSYEWKELSDVLKYYQGLAEFCDNPQLRDYTFQLMADIHHCDSVLIAFLNEPEVEQQIGHREFTNAIKDVSILEKSYSTGKFIQTLESKCIDYRKLEREKSQLQNFHGEESYDAKIIVLETEVYKYLKHIDKRIEAVEKHLHRVHPDRFALPELADRVNQD